MFLKSPEWVTGVCVLYENQDTEVVGKNIKVHFQSYLSIICLHISYTCQLSFSLYDCPFLKSYVDLHN